MGAGGGKFSHSSKHSTAAVADVEVNGGESLCHEPIEEIDTSSMGRMGHRKRRLREVCLPRSRLSSEANLCPGLAVLAQRIGPSMGLIDCGGGGDCGPLTLAFLLNELKLSTLDGSQLRAAVVDHARACGAQLIFDPSTGTTLADLIIASFASWSPSDRPEEVEPSLEGWCDIVEKAGEYTDAGFLCSASDLFRVRILVSAVDRAGAPVPEACFVINPCDGAQPQATLRIAALVRQHFVAIVRVESSTCRGGATPRPSIPPVMTPPSKPPPRMATLINICTSQARAWHEFTHSEILIAEERAVDLSLEEAAAVATDAEACAISAALTADAESTSHQILLGQQLSAKRAEQQVLEEDTELALALSASEADANHEHEVQEYRRAVERAIAECGREGASTPAMAPQDELILDEEGATLGDFTDFIAESEDATVDRAVEVGLETSTSMPRYPFPLPLRTEEDLRALLADTRYAPTDLVACEFSGAMRTALEREGRRALSADWRECEVGGLHFCGDVRLVLNIQMWERAYIFPPCSMTLRRDVDCLDYKIADGRAFWGMAFVIYCWTVVTAVIVVLEQPDTLVADYYPLHGTEILTTSSFALPSVMQLCAQATTQFDACHN